MKRFFKVRLLPLCLTLLLLLQALPVMAQSETVYHLGMYYAAESQTYGTVAPNTAFSHLYYDQLENDMQRELYARLAQATPGGNIIALETTDIPVITVPAEGATPAFQAEIMAFVSSQVFPAYAAAALDTPLMFWASGVRYGANLSVRGDTVYSITIQCIPDASGNYSQAGYDAAVKKIQDVFAALEVPAGDTYQQLKYFHDYLCDTVVYVDGANAHNITGPLLEGKSVCEGYAKAFKLYCDLLEIPCITITGMGYTGSGSEAHAWNAVRMEDGKWYAVDVTWDDQPGMIYYDFFLTGGETVPESFNPITFNESHVAMGDFFGNGEAVFDVPSLNDTAYGKEDVHTHEYGFRTYPPTCHEDGYTVYTCDCGDSYVGNIVPSLGHSYAMERKEPTCEEDGYVRRFCNRCGDSYDEILPALGHNLDTQAVPPSCEEDGYLRRYCNNCGAFYDEIYPATGHNWDDGVVTVQPTEFSVGEKVYTCYNCGEKKAETLPRLEHFHDLVATVTPPTCTEEGYTTYTCYCGLYYTDDYLSPTGHNYLEDSREPTCTEDGYKGAFCEYCGEGGSEIIPAHGHSYQPKEVPPTCTEDGRIFHVCEYCGNNYSEAGLPATGHTWDDGAITVEPTEETEGEQIFTCKVCGKTQTVILPTLAHTHKHETIVTPPTCEKEGFTTYTCKCGDSFIGETVPALGHSFEESTIPPTCTEEGALLFTCKNCGRVDSKVLPPMGHSYEVAYTEPTCTESGFATYTCHCGDSYVADYVDPTGHDFALTSAVEPTCEEGGVYTFECSNCGLSYTETLPPNGHAYTAKVTPPTCEEEGFTTYACENCGVAYTDDSVPALGHSFGDWKEVAPGKEERTCANCGETESRDKVPVYDVDGDGVVDQSDVTSLMSVLVGNTETAALYDFDFDGKLTIFDCVLLLQQIS